MINAKTVATVPFRSLISFHHHTGSYIYKVYRIQHSWLWANENNHYERLISDLCRISLTATPGAPAIQNCLHRLHRLMSRVFFLSKRKIGRKICSVTQNTVSSFIGHHYKQTFGGAKLHL